MGRRAFNPFILAPFSPIIVNTLLMLLDQHTPIHRYPVGIQTFSEIRTKGYLYVDKTEYLYRLAHADSKYIFLSRPRRFGKSLLVSTLKSYFEGRKDLFEGLAIAQLEQDWTAYPVLHFSLAGGKHMEKAALEEYLDYILSEQEATYGINNSGRTPNVRLMALIRAAYAQTHRQVVLLIDEYDAPLLDVVHEDEHLDDLRHVMRNFYSPIKDADPYLRFVFMTGITKFSQMSIFSELNNINNISMLPEYGGLCGITKEELTGQMRPDVAHLGERLGMSYEEPLDALRDNYDGYHFSWPSPDVFNPFSLLSALANGNLDAYWFSTGTPTYLLKMMARFKVLASHFSSPFHARKSAFDAPTEHMKQITPLLYQSGYLTIKDYDRETGIYTLDLPNREIRVGLFESMLPDYLCEYTDDGDVTIARMSKLIREDDMDGALRLLQTFFSTVPYCNRTESEGHYQQMLFIVFSLLTPFLVDVEVHTHHGRIDMVLMTHTRIYILEVKLNRDARTALAQINLKDYRSRFALSGLPVTRVGVNFDTSNGQLTDWVVEG